jgi:glycosyltransferase involved in cell wall biosynthesis
MLGMVKTEMIKSPVGFSKKALRKLARSGGLRFGLGNTSRLLSTAADIRYQYKTWIALNEPDEIELREQSKVVDGFAKKPLISIITPVFNPPADVFIDLIETVLAQTYPNFELCLGNFGDEPEIVAIIERYAKTDKRVRNLKFDDNQGIAANSNKILGESKGEYIALLDHDDTLSPDALYEVVKTINETGAEFIFSDKDKIDVQGNRFDPFFKPGYSPEIMLNANYFTHLNVMKRTIVDKVGGWSPETDGAQDWDLFLKIMLVTDKIVHLPKVLYHWRVIPTSTAMSIETKPYALAGQRVAIDKYLTKLGSKAKSYHIGAELLLKWPQEKRPVTLLVTSSSPAATRRFFDNLHEDLKGKCIILTDQSNYTAYEGETVEQLNPEAVSHDLKKITDGLKDGVVVVVSDQVDSAALDQAALSNLSGWLTLDDVVAASPRLNDTKTGRSVDCGAIATPTGLTPVFRSAVPYQQDPGGNIEWVKDVTVGSPLMFVAETAKLRKVVTQLPKVGLSLEMVAASLQLELGRGGERIVHNPKVTLPTIGVRDDQVEQIYELAGILYGDTPLDQRYYNQNLDPDNIGAIIEVTQETASASAGYDMTLPSAYNIEAMAHASNYVVDDNDIAANKKHLATVAETRITTETPSYLFVLPGFNGIYAGLNNIFSFADEMRGAGSKVTFALMVEPDTLAGHRSLIGEKFPELSKESSFITATMASAPNLPAADIAVCTQWATAYVLLKYNHSKRKCYFIQDKEASFYPKGSISALVDNTYRFGYYALANTPGLLEWYQKDYDGIGVTIKSNLSLERYSIPNPLNTTPKKPYKVFIYGRPGEPRNAFELGVEALRLLKKRYGGEVEIYAAGAQWTESDYALEDVMVNLGKISFDKLPSFYRSMDVGLMFMFSGHPGVVASELMASGCPVVVNQYDDKTWRELYQHEETALVSLPTAKAIFENIDRVLKDTKLRETLIDGGDKTIKKFYADYTESCHAATKQLRSSGKLT